MPLTILYLFAPVKNISVRTGEVVRVETSKLSEVARAAPVGFAEEPYIPVMA